MLASTFVFRPITPIPPLSAQVRSCLALRNRLANGYRSISYETHFANNLESEHGLLRLLPRDRQKLDAEFRFRPTIRAARRQRVCSMLGAAMETF